MSARPATVAPGCSAATWATRPSSSCSPCGTRWTRSRPARARTPRSPCSTPRTTASWSSATSSSRTTRSRVRPSPEVNSSMEHRRVVAMGGGGFSMEPENPLLDRFVLSLVRASPPRVCFVPTASGDAEGYVARFYRAFTGLDCRPSDLPLFGRTIGDLESFVLGQDVIYVGGGNTANLLAVWRVHGLDRILRTAWEQGIVMCGLSAGMNCWFEGSVTDSFGLSQLAPLHDGLGLLPGSACPHFDGEEQRRPRARVARPLPRLIGRRVLPGKTCSMPRAVRFDRYGDIDVLHVVDVERPTPGPGEVLVRVKAAGINPGEASIRKGLMDKLFPATFPSGEGSDFAGVVEEIGPGVEEFAVGDEVLGWSDQRSSHAELVVVPATQLIPKPAGVSWEAAGALYVAGATAW